MRLAVTMQGKTVSKDTLVGLLKRRGITYLAQIDALKCLISLCPTQALFNKVSFTHTQNKTKATPKEKKPKCDLL